jgi:hypothetical protein
MNKSNKLLIIVIVFAFLVVALILFLAYYPGFTRNSLVTYPNNSSSSSVASSSTPGLIKHLGINLDYYDPATKKAGDIEFTDAKLGEYDLPFFEFGYVIPASSARPNPMPNPQPTIIVPLGTKVHSLVDGKVFNVPLLYSKDYSVQVMATGSDYIFETEHVINPLVKKGDKVKAGQVIAEVSDYDAHNYSGFGLYEIGVLKGGNPPVHLCPFAMLDPSIKDDTLAKLRAFYKSWNEFKGKQVYDETLSIPGCISTEAVPG